MDALTPTRDSSSWINSGHSVDFGLNRYTAEPKHVLALDIECMLAEIRSPNTSRDELPKLACMVQSKAIEYRSLTGEHYFKSFHYMHDDIGAL